MSRSKIFTGSIYHKRFTPCQHEFKYPAFFSALYLDELSALNKTTRFFSYNQKNILSVYDKDYLDLSSKSLTEKVQARLKQELITDAIDDFVLITTPRYLNYVFNPVSFVYCLKGDRLVAVIAQVNNTFSEQHLYVLTPDKNGGFSCKKDFHVSPFFSLDGHYDFQFSKFGDSIDIGISYHKEGEKQLYARLVGNGKAISTRSILGTILKFPLLSTLNFPRITKEALTLYYRKKLRVYSKPVPQSLHSFKKRGPSLFERFSKSLVLRFFSSLKGKLSLQLPSGKTVILGDHNSEDHAAITVLDYAFFSRILKFQDIGFAESYMNGEWKTESLTTMIQFFIKANPDDKAPSFLTRFWHRLNIKAHRSRKNKKSQSKDNISDHYDLSNEMFELFLDNSLMYSAAKYSSPEQSLDEAQAEKRRHLIEMADISEADHVLEIGSGWGSMAIDIAQNIGARVDTITLSDEQYRYVQDKIKSLGLEDKVRVLLQDYRDTTGHYDAIVSIEMIEAVGHEYLDSYFKACSTLLKKGKRFVLQAITIPDSRYERYKRSCDFIQKHIFPGGHLPSHGELKALSTRYGLSETERHSLTEDYATTLSSWRDRFIKASDAIMNLGFDQNFIRKFLYYFSYCEAGFLEKMIDTDQIVYIKE